MTQSAEQKTGTSNQYYDLVSIMYHSLKGATTYEKYIHDAEQRGDNELAQFFRRVQQEDRQRAQQAQQLLASRVSQGGSR
ncbi:MAG TPA: hypothetical protein VFA41_09995 [Ktedonobacteraceae bacterium]|jgi:rubrerythrin|nr:hypothetical protein [Ktedonobacteraceae bacterium]